MALPTLNFGSQDASPADGILQGLGAGYQIQQQQAQQQQAQALAAQEQAKLQQQQQQQQALQSFYAIPNPTVEDYSRISTLIPSLSENFKRISDMRSEEQNRTALADVGQVHAALKNGRPDFALSHVNQRIAALKNSGGNPREIQALQTMAGIIEKDPNFALKQTGLSLASMPGGDKVLTALSTAGQEARAEAKAPYELRTAAAGADKSEADAKTAGVAAKYAESSVLADLDKKKWDIAAIKADMQYKKDSTRIAAMNADINKSGNDLKRKELELKLEDAVAKRDAGVRERVAEAESGAANIDNMLNTVQRILKNPNLNDVVGGIEGRLPAVSDASVDAIALIETLGSQAFLAQIPNIKGMGALSNAEGEKLQSALQNLSRKQSESQFRANLNEASRILTKSRDMLSKRTGVPLGKPDTPAAPGSRPPLDSFQR